MEYYNLKPKTDINIPDPILLKMNDQIIEQPYEVANHFNSYFLNAASEMNKNRNFRGDWGQLKQKQYLANGYEGSEGARGERSGRQIQTRNLVLCQLSRGVVYKRPKNAESSRKKDFQRTD
ncbi:hypothetical protein JTB14_014391 [Gonioctena quinquepunctata]|nr:hypothetical protein JTB14_014391 [Gonioctena quinquepunctata]